MTRPKKHPNPLALGVFCDACGTRTNDKAFDGGIQVHPCPVCHFGNEGCTWGGLLGWIHLFDRHGLCPCGARRVRR